MRKRAVSFVLALAIALLPLIASAATFEPSRAIAYMEAKFTCGCERGGSGVMIGRYGLLTAAHNLYCQNHGKQLKYCNFYFGAKSANSCWYKYSGNFHYRVYETFKNGYSSENDIGYVIFDSAVGKETGWFACRVGSDSYLNEEYTHIDTYDFNRHLQSLFSIQYVRGSKQIYWDGWISGAEGGPVYFWSEGMEYPEVIGVYTSHDSNGNGYGRRLTNDVFKDMQAEGAFR